MILLGRYALVVAAMLGATASISAVSPHPQRWQPSPGHVQVPIWPTLVPDAVPHPPPETLGPPAGRDWWPMVSHVGVPTITYYAPSGRNTGAAVLVFPGGGYQILAMDLEGTEVCDWLTSRGITCVLLKYRVPDSGPTMREGHRYYPRVETALQDAQRAIGLVRRDAAAHGTDPHRIGVIGFSAGGHLAAALSTHPLRSYRPVDAADRISCRPDFAMLIYPGHLWVHEDEDNATRDYTALGLHDDVRPTAATPPTFLVQAEDDDVDGVSQVLAYYVALHHVGVPAEMHLYAKGGHAFGLRSKLPVGRWPLLAEQWMRDLGMLGPRPR